MQEKEQRLCTYVVTDRKGDKEICAFSSCYLNFNKDTIVVKTIARKLGRTYAGLGRSIADAITQIALEKGYSNILHAFMHQQNSSKSLSKKQNAIALKNYALYELCI